MTYDLNETFLTHGLIPHGTIIKAVFNLRKGGVASSENKDGWITQSKSSKAKYLAGNFVVIEGPFKYKMIFKNIGLHSEKSTFYETMGKKLISLIIDSALNFKGENHEITNYEVLDGLICICKVIVINSTYKDQKLKNDIIVLTPSNQEYQDFLNSPQCLT